MNQEFDFFKTSMPDTRIADYYLGCLDGCVFLDFDLNEDNRINLRRISFDGYGCCNLGNTILPMTKEESQRFIDIYKDDQLNQEALTDLVTNTIKINKEYIWQDALKEYGLIE